ncbi:alpha/beta hydrolase family protein [Maribellus maritimus]|uniref:alpha/beta hydrolase family protein n=1 Tax=Maribellus maritimus TaxID=2870838 RepID=UPI001EEB3A06|nr:alpha/beta hydrolase [Maribellus maritimus]MCG6187384.1 alpha/beta fold hydrolase [Maribellus maritimus]
MRQQRFLSAFVLFFFLQTISFAQETNQQRVLGNWSGNIELPTAKLGVIFRISAEDDSLSCKMDVPLQGAEDLPVSKVSLEKEKIILTVKMIQGVYEGQLKNDSTLEGTWEQRGAKFPLTLKKTKTITKLKRPQTPQGPFPYLSEEVEYSNPKSGFLLAGTLTIPEDTNNCPAVILISGSGAQDRDETIFQHKPFWVIADFLSRNGIAVLRVDDRGVGGSEGHLSEATSEDFAGDVIAGIDFLKSKDRINPEKIGLIGHSEGGLIAPLVASQTRDVAFIVLLAGPGITGEQILYKQNDLLLAAMGMDQNAIDKNSKLQQAIFNIIQTEKDSAKQIDRLQRAYSNGMYPMLNAEQKVAIDAQVAEVNNAWFRFFLSYDPAPTLKKVKCPVLALNGAKDLQVLANINLNAIKEALKEGGNTNFKTIKLEQLNHLFQQCKTGAVAEYGEIEETISPEVLEIIKNWIGNVSK